MIDKKTIKIYKHTYDKLSKKGNISMSMADVVEMVYNKAYDTKSKKRKTHE